MIIPHHAAGFDTRCETTRVTAAASVASVVRGTAA
jgi:hypothetical protein